MRAQQQEQQAEQAEEGGYAYQTIIALDLRWRAFLESLPKVSRKRPSVMRSR